MTELTANRTLVKSPPELWAECSDAASLSRHLEGFGQIRITRLEPETVVAWEGESASGTVRLEPSGWGTKVVLTAVGVAVEEPVAVAVAVEEEPPHVAEIPRPGPFARLLGLFRRHRAPAPEPESVAEPEPEPEPDSEPESPGASPVALELMALEQALDSLGQAHHRPFSRA